ncbi:MAG: 16S rRNA (cytosine(967)-C(5))-methyltransferase RsmB [Actinomycetota bacterium]|nr:16S rRNA (cytosine(967)-C(5))-methyltransferase RsmB [Actinomycetota bacterium]
MSEVTPERAAAYAVLRRTFEGDEYTELAFRHEAEQRELTGRSRSQAMRMAYGAVQRKGSVDAIVSGFIKKKGQRPEPAVMAALRLGVFELLFSDGTPDHAVVDQAVSLTRSAGSGHAAGFVNALLRRTLRERDRVVARLADDSTPEAAAVAHSAPKWLVDLWWEQLGPERARAVLAAANEPSEKALRVNTARTSREEIIERLSGDDLELSPATGDWPMAPDELLVARGNLAEAEVAAEEGLLVAQSRGSAAVVEVLDPLPGERVLDLCAGPGIKTGQIAVRVGRQGNMVSVEPSEERAGEVAAQLERLGFHNGLVIEADARHGEILSSFDRILVDAPCSDLGALSSRPDARWRKSPALIDRVAELQAEILDKSAEYLLPGGTLVYSTCTISVRENASQVRGFAERSGLEIDDLGALAPGLADAGDTRFLQLLPDRDRTTGFFIARLRKPLAPPRSG